MYEFVDAHGERVTVRSVRTLAGLLQGGAITPLTPFRRAEDAAFGPAATHAELQELAAELKLAWERPGGVAPRTPEGAATQSPYSYAQLPPAATPPPPQPAATPSSAQRTSVPATPGVAVMPIAVQTIEHPPPVVGKSPWSRFAPPEHDPAGRDQRPRKAAFQDSGPAFHPGRFQSRQALARISRPPPGTIAGSAGVVLVNLASAAVLGAVARFVVADASGSRPLAMLAMVAVTWLGGHYAGRTLAKRKPRLSGWSVSLAAAVFAAGCYGVAEAAGLVIAAAAAVPLWRELSQPRR